MRTIIIERDRRSLPRFDFGRTALDLEIPSIGCVGIGSTIEAAEQLKSKTRPFFGWKPEQVLQSIRNGHV